MTSEMRKKILENVTPEVRAMLDELAEAAGGESTDVPDAPKYPKSHDYIAALTAMGYVFTMRELDDAILVNDERLTDSLAAEIRTRLRDFGYAKTKEAEDAYTAHARANTFHPVRDYLRSLEWDGQDHIGQLSDHIVDKHDPIVYSDGTQRTVSHAFMRRWLIGAVSKAFNRGSVQAQNPMLVWDGAQEIGKSTVPRWLCSPLDDMYVESSINPSSKDDLIRLTSTWIWEVAELGATTRKQDREELKHFITLGKATYRPPYGKHAIEKPALASFFGTINNEAGFLTDPTGNRRFLPVTIASINWAYSSDVDVNQVWAQAYALYIGGESHDLTPEERSIANVLRDSYQVEDVYEQWLRRYFEFDATQIGWKMAAADVTEHLQYKGMTGQTRAIQMGAAPALRRLCGEPERMTKGRYYSGIRKRSDDTLGSDE